MSYLIYNSFKNDEDTSRYHTVLDQVDCDRYKEEYLKGHNICGIPVHMDPDMVEAWYPKSLSEKVDKVLLYFYSHTRHLGQKYRVKSTELIGVLFGDLYEIEYDKLSGKNTCTERNHGLAFDECKYLLNYMRECKYIEFGNAGDDISVGILPVGLNRIDDLQKYNNTGKNVFVAMQFDEDTIVLREKIKQGITAAGYNPILIDEVEHNEYIMPELLKYIRDSKFMVVDLTHHNNGAYFEEGYAMGVGKPVIQLCQKGETTHFDISQKCMIMWETEDEIPEKLKNRIAATID